MDLPEAGLLPAVVPPEAGLLPAVVLPAAGLLPAVVPPEAGLLPAAILPETEAINTHLTDCAFDGNTSVQTNLAFRATMCMTWLWQKTVTMRATFKRCWALHYS